MILTKRHLLPLEVAGGEQLVLGKDGTAATDNSVMMRVWGLGNHETRFNLTGEMLGQLQEMLKESKKVKVLTPDPKKEGGNNLALSVGEHVARGRVETGGITMGGGHIENVVCGETEFVEIPVDRLIRALVVLRNNLGKSSSPTRPDKNVIMGFKKNILLLSGVLDDGTVADIAIGGRYHGKESLPEWP